MEIPRHGWGKKKPSGPMVIRGELEKRRVRLFKPYVRGVPDEEPESQSSTTIWTSYEPSKYDLLPMESFQPITKSPPITTELTNEQADEADRRRTIVPREALLKLNLIEEGNEDEVVVDGNGVEASSALFVNPKVNLSPQLNLVLKSPIEHILRSVEELKMIQEEALMLSPPNRKWLRKRFRK